MREREKPESEKREDRKRRCAGRLRQNWATEHNPRRTDEKKIKDGPGNRAKRETEREMTEGEEEEERLK